MNDNHLGAIIIGACIIIGSLIIGRSIDKLGKNISFSQEQLSRSIASSRPIIKNISAPNSKSAKDQKDAEENKVVSNPEGDQVLNVWEDGKKSTLEGFDFLVTFDKLSHHLTVDYYLHDSEKHEIVHFYNPRKWEFKK